MQNTYYEREKFICKNLTNPLKYRDDFILIKLPIVQN